MRPVWHTLALVPVLLVASACTDSLEVVRNDAPWPYSELRSELRRSESLLELVLAAWDPGPPGVADAGRTYRLVVALDASAAPDAEPRALAIDGTAIFPAAHVPPTEPSAFDPGDENDAAVLRAFITELCFCGGNPVEVREHVIGELVLEGFSDDGALHGTVDVQADRLPSPIDVRVAMRGPFTAVPVE